MGNIFAVTISTEPILSRFQDWVIKKERYITQLEDNLDALRTSLEDLIEAKNDVMTRVRIAEQQQMKRLNKVQLWLIRVEDVEAEVLELHKDGTKEIENPCLGGYCFKNFNSTYKLGKKVFKKLQEVNTLKDEGVFDAVAEWVPEAAADERPIGKKTIVGQQRMLDEIWRCLHEEVDVGIIGVYGMGGVGKTTLLTQLNNKFSNMLNGFDVVIWVTVSKDLQLQKIQEEIGKKLCLVNESWNNKSLEDKAREIFKILTKKKFLLLLDDLWEHVDLNKVGVPLPDTENASKIVLTTRFFHVCTHMEAEKKFKVECLPPEEAWELFRMKVGEDTLNSHPDIPRLAKYMTEECGGLPLALITIGRAMACMNTHQEWEHEIVALRRSASEFSGMEMYSHLKFSYDKLPNDKTRSCFLYCSLFPEDYSIYKRNLIDYWISEGFLDENDDRSSARNEGFYIIGVLIRACLLEEEDDDYVKMHDVIRDMGLWIATKIEEENQNFLVEAGIGLTEAPGVNKWKGMRRMSLMENKIKDLSEIPTCPDLQTLFLSNNYLKLISSNFFQFMPSLMVLNLSNNPSLTQLPSGFSELVSLQHLDLSNTGIEELPKGLEALEDLKYLNLEHTIFLRVIPREMISNFSRLHVLRMFECGYSGEELIRILRGSKFLHVLSINLKSSNAVQEFLSSHDLKWCTQTLGLQCSDDITSLDVSSLADMKQLNTLCVSESKYLEELAIHSGTYVEKIQTHDFYNLHTIEICSCKKLRDLTWIHFATNLKFLSVLYCSEMKEIINTRKLLEVQKMRPTNPFGNLKALQLEGLPNLKRIFQGALPFPHLKEIRVVQCPKLNELPLDIFSAKVPKLVIWGKEQWWKELKWKDQDTQNVFSPCFKSIEADFKIEVAAEIEDVAESQFQLLSDRLSNWQFPHAHSLVPYVQQLGFYVQRPTSSYIELSNLQSVSSSYVQYRSS